VALPELVTVGAGSIGLGFGLGLARRAVPGSDEVADVLEVRLRVATARM
jgi:hypothetical protein